MIIGISGTPGCGKTQVSSRLAKLLNYTHIELTAFIKKHNISESFDEEAQSLVVDIPLLEKTLKAQLDLTKNYIIDGHFSQDLSFISGVIVCTCELKELKRRLEVRKYSQEKVRENLDAEIFQICYSESIENDLPTITLDCSRELTDTQIIESYEKLKAEISQYTK